MNPTEALELMVLIRNIRERGITVLLIEHHMKVVMGISDRIAVLEYGHKIAEGTPQEVCANPAVIAAYLGATC
jgi:ABC-type branched-subunit amino acid transport system ATPase component